MRLMVQVAESDARMISPRNRIRLIAGLGNPGIRYHETRHNAGFMVVDEIADYFGIDFTWQISDAVLGSGDIEKIPVVLVKPMAFMNVSGPPLKQICRKYGISDREVLIVHDDIDLALGRVKIKMKGGDGGHKGLRSIIDALGANDFCRLRIGVGRSGMGSSTVDHVLEKFESHERPVIRQVCLTARDAAVSILCTSADEAMNRFNNKNSLLSNSN
jgi:peptidyl-tRNA hydrolase, PTH1 family